jgi:hypothetical protein
MSENHPEPTFRLVFEIGKLMRDYPLKIWHPNKKIVFEIA